ncbi:hypothetical protein FJQ87_18350 (plasmid) [Shewanella sp. SNU WT4]|nr:hypothetical protein FJQ87_18350 [Shewanella sp. SNU WT4]
MTKKRTTIEDECIKATLAQQRMFTSEHHCDGCHSESPKRYSVSGKCVSCKATGVKNTTDNHHWTTNANDLRALNEVRVVTLILKELDKQQRLRVLNRGIFISIT